MRLGDTGTRGRGTRRRGDSGTQGRDKQTTPEFCAEFAFYNFRWSRERYCLMESLPVADDFQRPWSHDMFACLFYRESPGYRIVLAQGVLNLVGSNCVLLLIL